MSSLASSHPAGPTAKRWAVALYALLLFFAPPAPADPPGTPDSPKPLLIHLFDERGLHVGHLLGFFVSDTMLITASHGLTNISPVEVEVSGARLPADALLADDPDTDISILRCDLPPGASLFEIAPADPPVGAAVRIFTFENPAGPTEKHGVVYTTRQSLLNGLQIETSIPSDPGESGGPLLQDNQVVGLVSSLHRDGGKLLCSATPARSITRIVQGVTPDAAPTRLQSRIQHTPRAAAEWLNDFADQSSANGNEAKSVEYLRLSIKADGTYWRPRYALVSSYLTANQISAANAELDAWDKSGVEPWLCSYLRGMVLERAGDTKAAVAAYTRSEELKPTVEAMLPHARCLISLKDTNAAADLYSRAVSVDYKNGHPWREMAELRASIGDAMAAVVAARRAVELDCRSDNIATLAMCLAQSQQPGPAMKAAWQLSDRDDATFDALYKCSNVLSWGGDADHAITLLQKAVRADDKQPVGWLALGRLLAAAHQDDRAAEAFERSLALHSEPVTLYELGIVYVNLNRKDDAARVCSQLKDQDPSRAAELNQLLDGHAGQPK